MGRVIREYRVKSVLEEVARTTHQDVETIRWENYCNKFMPFKKYILIGLIPHESLCFISVSVQDPYCGYGPVFGIRVWIYCRYYKMLKATGTGTVQKSFSQPVIKLKYFLFQSSTFSSCYKKLFQTV